MDFVNHVAIDPIYFEKAYYLAPAEGGAKVYELLKRAMNETGKVAVARVVIRNRESLAALRVSGNTLVMSTMHYPDEVRDAFTLPELNYQVNLHDNEVKMAVSLINSLSSEFQPEKYNDTYRDKMMEIIQAKIAGEEITTPSQRETGKVVDLMEALKASIDLAKEERGTDRQAKKSKGRKETKVSKDTAQRKTS
jgi:DNA end-binding protein Ku